MTQDFDKIFEVDKAIPDEFISQVADRVFEMMHGKNRREEFKSQTFKIGPTETDDQLSALFNDGWKVYGSERFNELVLFTFVRVMDSTPVYSA